MSKHIFNTFRKFLISTALKIMPLHASNSDAPEPVTSAIDPTTDTWLFDKPRSLSAHMLDFTHEMGALSGSLSRLHGLVSMISAEAPEAVLAHSPVVNGVVWSDALLFDGEPEAVTSDEVLLSGASDLLFDAPENAPNHPIDGVMLSNLASRAAQGALTS